MKGKNIPLTGRELRVLSGRLLSLSMIFLLISATVTMQGCSQVTGDMVMQCFGCIQGLQSAISSELQNRKTQTRTSLEKPGKTSLSSLSTQDLITLFQSLEAAKNLNCFSVTSQKNTTTFSSVSPTNKDEVIKVDISTGPPDEAMKSLENIYKGVGDGE